MITPRFSLDQTDVQLIINVYAPYTNVKDTEIEVIEDCVIFYSTPYYLRYTTTQRRIAPKNIILQIVVIESTLLMKYIFPIAD